jgi:hypothetical protein
MNRLHAALPSNDGLKWFNYTGWSETLLRIDRLQVAGKMHGG